eukprot:1157653-Pelagomonas_calceolata.AAC.7
MPRWWCCNCAGGGAAIVAAAQLKGLGKGVAAVVSRGGRPDLAGDALKECEAPTLLIVGGLDYQVIEMNKWALAQLPSGRLEIVPGATHLVSKDCELMPRMLLHLSRRETLCSSALVWPVTGSALTSTRQSRAVQWSELQAIFLQVVPAVGRQVKFKQDPVWCSKWSKKKKRKVYAGHRPRALRQGPLTNKLTRASPSRWSERQVSGLPAILKTHYPCKMTTFMDGT